MHESGKTESGHADVWSTFSLHMCCLLVDVSLKVGHGVSFVAVGVPAVVDAAPLQVVQVGFSLVCSRLCASEDMETMTLEERTADREVENDDGRYHLPT